MALDIQPKAVPHGREALPTAGVARSRLSASPAQLLPWVRADSTLDFSLYWLPLSGFPSGHDETVWLRAFVLLLADRLAAEAALRAEIFVQIKSFFPRNAHLLQQYRGTSPMLAGLARIPGSEPPPMHTAEDAQRAAAAGTELRLEDSMADYCYWLYSGELPRHLETMLGLGGVLALFFPPDPNPAPAPLPMTPKLRAAMPGPPGLDLDGMIRSATRMREGFLAQSKRVFGRGLESRPEYGGLPFIVPNLPTADLLRASAEERAEWFSLFPVLLMESPRDTGVVLAFQRDFEPLLADLLATLRQTGPEHPSLRQVVR